MEDKIIIEMLFARNEQAIQFIDEKYGNLMNHVAGHILSDIEDIYECKNDSLLAVWNTIPPKNPEYFKAYICKIVRNNALNKMRFDTAKKRSDCIIVAIDELGECIVGGTSPEELIESKELVRHLNNFLADVDEENRMIFMRRYFFGDTIEEISERFSIRSNTVSAKLSRLRKSLRAYLKEQEVYV